MSETEIREAVRAAGGIYYEMSGSQTDPGTTVCISVYPRAETHPEPTFEFGNSFETGNQMCADGARIWHKGVADGLRRAKEIRHV